MVQSAIVNEIIEASLSNKHEAIVKKFYFQTRRMNELLCFLKPECFLVDNVQSTNAILEMVLRKFEQYNIEIDGALLLKGRRLDELGCMDHHYGFINKLSRRASQIITDIELAKIQQKLNLTGLSQYKVLGGHEFLNKFNEYDEKSLDVLWSTKKSVKLRSGFYVQGYTVNEENILLINGFHPAQLQHFTDSSHQIALFLLHSDTDWKILKTNLVGATFPDHAEKDSIRGELFQNNQKYGLQNVSVANNCVHLSAGPFEALFEINNFLNNIQELGYDLVYTNVFRLMSKNGFDRKVVEHSLENPISQNSKNQVDLFTFTEDKNSPEAISDYINFFSY